MLRGCPHSHLTLRLTLLLHLLLPSSLCVHPSTPSAHPPPSLCSSFPPSSLLNGHRLSLSFPLPLVTSTCALPLHSPPLPLHSQLPFPPSLPPSPPPLLLPLPPPPPLPPPAPPSSSTPPSSSRVSGEKRGKESSDEDGEEKKAEVAATQAMIEEYNLLKSKRQKLKERKERAKQRRAEVDLRPLLSDEVEKQRVWLLNGLNPTPDEIDRASRGHTGVHPALLELLRDVRLEDIFPLVPPEVMVEIRRLFLSPPTFTQHAVYAVCDAYIATHCGRAP